MAGVARRRAWVGGVGLGLLLCPESRAQSSLDDFLSTTAVMAPRPSPRKSSDISRVRKEYGPSFRACEAGMHVGTRVVVMFDVVIDKRGRITKLEGKGASGLPAEVTECLDDAVRVVRARVRMPPASQSKELQLPLDLRGPIWTSSLSLPVSFAAVGEQALAPELGSAMDARAEDLGRCVAQAIWGEATRGRPSPAYALVDLISDGVEVAFQTSEAGELQASVVSPTSDPASQDQRASLFERLWTGEAADRAGGCYSDAFAGLEPAPDPGARVAVEIDMSAAEAVYPPVD